MRNPSVWKNRDFVLLWSGQVLSTLGSAASTIIFPMLVLEMSGSPFSAGVTTALSYLPFLIFSIPAGISIDRWDRKKIMQACDLGRMLLLLAMAMLLLNNQLTVNQLYFCAFVEGVFFVFFNIAETSALTKVVNLTQLTSAAAQNEMGSGAANVIGPPIGTALYQYVHKSAPFFADALTYFLSWCSLCLIKTNFQESAQNQNGNFKSEILEGVDWLRSQSQVCFLAFLAAGSNVIVAASPIVILVLAKNIGAEEKDIGLIFSLSSFGGVLGALVAARIQSRFSLKQILFTTLWIQFLFFPLYLWSSNLIILAAITGLISLTWPVYNVAQFSFRLSLIPDHLQGRVNAIFRFLAVGAFPIGAGLAGLLLESIDPALTVLVFTAIIFILAITATVKFR